MIAACPKCAARYRIERERLEAGAVRLRCARCEAVFRVRPPLAEPRPAISPAPRTPVAQEPTPALLREAPLAAAPAALLPPSPRSPAPRTGESVLIAMSDVELSKRTAALLTERGCEVLWTSDGVETMLEIQRKLPRAVVLAADLPKMFGFQICEIVKRNPSLRGTWVVLVGAIHHPDRYRREAADLYGADAYLEGLKLPDGLLPLLEQGGLRLDPARRDPIPPRPPPAPARPDAARREAPPTRPQPAPALPSREAPKAPVTESPKAPVTASPQAPVAQRAHAPLREQLPRPAPPAPVVERVHAPLREQLPRPAPPAPVVERAHAPLREQLPRPAPPAPVVERAHAPVVAAAPRPRRDDGLDPERAKAERLARIVVSDIVLYNEERFTAAARAGNVFTAMAGDLAEGRALFEERIDARVRAERDYLKEELLRSAKLRGMR